ncbi:Pyridoxal-phosphate-dependent serine hydroxymethyltransferase [Gossypium arboreum]|uniref:Pyridoxal-phosphate-dependent serine hydroxymethyltransferase n=1 Tax=Gossypium arboreum TaxID=29729 RepID=A0A0B0PW18_GOSAR|nr:Pyridoxal-phosphate-dependent serine hydroxymethyltransferase [Gossypium arboreum]
MPTPCPRHDFTLASTSKSMPCPRHGLTLALSYRCRCHVPDRSYTDTHQADAMFQTGLTLACIS